MMARVWVGKLATVVDLGMALALGVIASSARASDPGPGDLIPRGLVLGGLFATPGVIGGLGAISGRRVLLAAAGCLCLMGFPLAFSGVTLMFVIPGVLFLYSASVDRPSAAPRPRRRFLSAIAAAGSIPLVIGAVLTLGIFALGIMVIAIVLGTIVTGRFRVPRLQSAVLLLSLVGLGAGAGVGLFALTTEQCWIAHQTPEGLRYEIVPPPGANTVGYGDLVAAGCDGGTLSLQGIGLAATLSIGAIALAVMAATAPRSAD